MAMEIDDILTSLSVPSIPASTLDLQLLTRAWVNERTTPELLPYPSSLISRVSARITAQITRIEDLTSAMDPTANFALVVIQTELERFKFLLRSLLRTRMGKMDAFPLHYLQLARREEGINGHAHEEEEGQEGGNTMLSAMERRYLEHHTALLEGHYKASFLGAFPAQLQKMDDTGGGVSMVDAPDLDTAVFVRVLRDAGTVEVQGEQGVGEVELTRGDVWVLRWRVVREGVRRGDLEMI
ncbi:DNA replication complex GINS protein SLD5-like protein [Elsinoe fawcettii]|nr:DNA replication complex GINS protein SLD5-like protein [Elsinoe fawcettii]